MAEQFIRRPDYASGDLAPDEQRRMAEHARVWIANAYKTGRTDRVALGQAIRDLYRAANLAEPQVIVVPSPIVMAFAGGFASAIWHARGKDAKDLRDPCIWDASATEAATWAATRAATGAATEAATEAATRAATWAATEAATWAATGAATGAATRAATWAATGAATWAEKEALFFAFLAQELLGDLAQFGLQCANAWGAPYQGGNMWAAYDAYLTAARDVLGLQLQIHEKYDPWERAAKLGGFRWVHPKFCMVCDFPDVIERDEQNRPHCATGPSHRWSDGWSLYHWHGVRVPEYIIERPHEITLSGIEKEANAEVRRVMIARYGTARYIQDSGAQIVHELPDNYFVKGLRGAKLYRKPRKDDSDIIMVAVQNSTPEPDGSIKQYNLRIEPGAYGGKASTDCHAAVASTWRKADGSLYFKNPMDYRPAFES